MTNRHWLISTSVSMPVIDVMYWAACEAPSRVMSLNAANFSSGTAPSSLRRSRTAARGSHSGSM
ncbi:hypothetical protein [Halalkalicoccus jeotgali]|uniref:hypothetical protein n=1 Tax=Halalkalicoccus jeotgali TaxID=413810 RepID=UPI0009D98F0C|nr:hypothetical protein [Halalkalicoccus jeotgali]